MSTLSLNDDRRLRSSHIENVRFVTTKYLMVPCCQLGVLRLIGPIGLLYVQHIYSATINRGANIV